MGTCGEGHQASTLIPEVKMKLSIELECLHLDDDELLKLVAKRLKVEPRWYYRDGNIYIEDPFERLVIKGSNAAFDLFLSVKRYLAEHPY